MRNLLLITSLLLLFCSFSEDPIKISVREILSSVMKERRVMNNLQTIDYLNGLNYRLPILKDVGFKYGTDDLTNTKRQYATSLGFNTFKIIKEQASLKNAHINLYQAKRDMLLNQVLQERYMDMVDAYFSQNLLDKHNQLDSLLNQKQTVLKKSLQKGLPIKVKDLVETEDDLLNVRLALSEMNNVWSLSHQRIQEYVIVQKPFVISFDNFISITKLEEILHVIKTNKNLQTPELKINQSRINVSKSELRLEEAQFKQYFDGFQLIYQQKNKTDFSSLDFSFRIGVNFPIKSNFRPKQNALLLDLKETENDYQFALFQTERTLKTQLLMMENLIKQYRSSLDALNNSLSINLLNTPSVLATLLPADIIDLKIIQQRKNIELVKMNYGLLKEYIKLLVITGDLTYSPYRNYLSNNLEKW